MGRSFRRRRLWFIAVPIASLVLIPAVLFAVQRPTAAASTVLTIFTGVAEVARGQAEFVVASDGAMLSNGDRVRTNDAGHALITFFDGSTLEIEPSTTVRMDTASPNANGSITVALEQTLGRTWTSVRRLTHVDSKFEIKTPTSTAAVRGTGFLTEVLPSGETTVRTTDGTVAVSAQGQTVLVTTGSQTTVRPNEAPTLPAAMPRPSNTLRFGMHSPAFLVILDPLGRSCGIAAHDATVVRHIPGCVASEPGSEPQIIELPDPAPGTYRTVIAAIDPGGPFTLTATGLDDRGVVSFDLRLAGEGQPGGVFGSALDVRPGPDGRLSASGLAPLVTLQGPSSPSLSPSPRATASEPPTLVPALALPTLPVPPSASTVTASSTPTPPTERPALRTPAPEPTPAPTPTATPTPSTTPLPSRPALRTPPPEPTSSPTPAPTSTASPTADPTPSGTAPPPPATTTPVPGCTPSSNQPKKCVPG